VRLEWMGRAIILKALDVETRSRPPAWDLADSDGAKTTIPRSSSKNETDNEQACALRHFASKASKVGEGACDGPDGRFGRMEKVAKSKLEWPMTRVAGRRRREGANQRED
jgi:hypothetical protein